MKVLKTAAEVLLVVGATVVAGPVGTLAATAAVFGVEAATGGLFGKGPAASNGGSQTKWKADPYAGLPYVMGRTLVAGNVVAKLLRGNANEFMGIATVLSIGPIHAYEASFMNKTTMTWMVRDPLNPVGMAEASNGYRGYVWEQRTLGLCPETYAPGWSDGFAGWNNDNKLSGLASVFNIFCYNSKASDTLTSIPTPGWLVNGVLVYDPRLDSTYPGGSGSCRVLDESTYVYSENPHLHALTWCLGRWQNGVRVAGLGAPLNRINVASFVEGANLDDARGWKIGGQVYTRPDTPWNNLKAMLQAGGARPSMPGGIITAINRAPRVSLATITHADIVGKCTFAGTQKRRTRINGIIPQYRSEAHDWEMVSAKLVQVADYVTADGGERTKEVSYPLVQDVNQVAQLAAYDICDAREAGPGSIPLKPAWMNYAIGDCVTFQPEPGWSIKVLIVGRRIDPTNGSITYTVQGETDGKHAFALGKTGVAPAIAGLTYDSSIAAPTLDWHLAGTALTTTQGASIAALVVTGAVSSAVVDQVVFEYRLYVSTQTDEEGWQAAGFEAPTTVRKEITSVTPTTAYQVSVRYRVRGVLGPRAIFGPVTTGAGFIGDVDATKGAPSGTPVGSTTADNVANTVTNTVPAISSALATAQSQITTVQGDVAAAAATANSAASTASAAASGLAAEISRATGAEGTLSSQIYSLGTSVSGLSSSLSSEAIARANGDSALAGQITTVQAFATPNPNLLSNPTGALGLQGWTKAYAATLTTYFGIYGEGNYFYGTATSASGGLGYYQDIPCQSDIALSISADIFAGGLSVISGTAVSARVYIEWLNSSGDHISYSAVASRYQGQGWGRVTVPNQVSPAGTATARVWIDIWGDGSWSSTNTGWKRIKVEQGTACTAYSDDTTPGTLSAQITTETAARISAVSAVASSVTSLTATVNSNTAAISANYTALSNTDASLAASITTLNSNYGSLSSTVSSNYTTLSNGISTNASAISSLNSSYGSLSSTVTTQASAIADLQGRTGAYWSVTAVSGGGRASITLFSTTSYSGFDIVGDVRINGSLLVTGSVTADRVVANGITEVLQAYNGSSYSGPNLVDTGTTDPTTGDTIYAVDYWDVISLTVTMAYSGDIVALVAAKQWYYSGGRDWAAQITVDGTEVFYTEGGTGAISDSIALSGKLSVSAGTHTVKFRWRSSDSTLAMLAGKASLVTIRRYV